MKAFPSLQENGKGRRQKRPDGLQDLRRKTRRILPEDWQ
jgi:hypothetical protein